MAEHVDITSEATLVAALRLVRARIAEQKELEEGILGKLKELLGESTEARIGGKPVAYYRWTKPVSRVDTRRLCKEHPDLVEEYTRVGEPSRRFVLLDPSTDGGTS
jgi:predicted phage-related endonuclease